MTLILATMDGLVMKEANSILSMPVIYDEGILKENKKTIPANMD